MTVTTFHPGVALAAMLCCATPALGAGSGGAGAVGIPGGGAFGGPAGNGNGGQAIGQPGQNGIGPSGGGGTGGSSGSDVPGSGGAGLPGNEASVVSLNPLASFIGGGGGGGGLLIVGSDAHPAAMGGAGGVGVRLFGAGSTQLDNQGLIIGGGGGGGGVIDWGGWVNPPVSSNSVRGGDGGTGVLAEGAGAVLVNSGQIWGGGGGGAGQVTSLDGGSSVPRIGRGGDGGAAVRLVSDNQRFLNIGELRGGNAGASGVDDFGLGGAGVQVSGNGTSILQQGTIVAGLDSRNARGTAVLLSGHGNTLTLVQGSTTIGDVVFNAGGGNRLRLGGGSTAAVVVNGNLTFGSTGIYTVRATPTAMDRLDVTGRAALAGATVEVNAQSGAYSEQFSQVVLTASGTFVGSRFAGVTSDLAYLTPSLSYSADDKQVTLTLTRRLVPPVDPGTPVDPVNPGAGGKPLRFSDLVSEHNARAAANAVESMPTSNSVYGVAIGLPVGAPQAFFSSLAGDTHANWQSGLRSLSTRAAGLGANRLHSNLVAGYRPGAAIAQSDGILPKSAWPTSKALPAWAEVVGHRQSVDGDANAAKLTQNVYGLFIGADEEVGSNGWRVGGSLGFTKADASVKARDASADIKSYSASLYTGKGFGHGANRVNVLAGLAYTHHHISSDRSAADQTLKAKYNAHTTQLFGEVGYAMGQYSKQGVEPFAGINISQQRVGGFQESGGFAALRGNSSNDTTTSTTLGMRAHSDFKLAGKDARVKATVGWRHAFGDVKQAVTMAFVEGSNNFTVMGAPFARNTALLGLQAEVELSHRAVLELGYQGEYGSGTRDHAVNVKMRWAY